MRDRKLSDQTLPVKAAGTLVSPSIYFFYGLTAVKSRQCIHSRQPFFRRGVLPVLVPGALDRRL